MHLNKKSGKMLMSTAAMISAVLLFEGSGMSIVANAASANSANTEIVSSQSAADMLSSFRDFKYSDEYEVSSSGKSSSSTTSGTGVVTASYLNMRSGPSTKYSIVGGFSRGTDVKIIGEENGWYRVQASSSKTGWVCGDYVTVNRITSPSTPPSDSTSSVGKIIITASTLNARTGASTSSAIVGTVKRNEVYTYTAVKNGWYMITIPSGKTAYISGDYAKKFQSYAINGGGSYIWPTQSSKNISSYFGARNGRTHYGIDIAAGAGSQIIAAASGKVVTNSYEAKGYGYYVVIQQNDGMRAYYGHMKQASFLTVGATVNAGDTIGMVGSTGNSTGNHLHLEFRNGSTKINPLNYYPNIK